MENINNELSIKIINHCSEISKTLCNILEPLLEIIKAEQTNDTKVSVTKEFHRDLVERCAEISMSVDNIFSLFSTKGPNIEKIEADHKRIMG